jgi:hypothetical protein
MARQKHAWEVQARTRIDWLRAEAREAAIRRGGQLDDEGNLAGGDAGPYAGSFTEIAQRLGDAEDYMTASAGPFSWLRGIRVEGTWANIHTAHARLIEVGDDEQVLALLPDVQSAAASYLPTDDVWRKTAAAWQKGRTVTNADREVLSNALRRAYDANAERYTQLRRYRNILLGAGLLFAGLAVALSVITAVSPKALPLCFPAQSTQAKTAIACPTGAQDGPRAGDVALAAMLGMIGGAVGGMASLTRSSRATVTSYTLRVARMLLKVTLGAVTAIVGITFLRAGFVPGFSELKSQGEIIGYALVFGASQQLVTRIADQHGERVLKGASADADGG